MKNVVWCAAFAATALMLAGCGAGTSGTTASAGAAPQAVQGANGLHLPIEAYFLRASQRAELDDAESIATSRCMKTFGFSYSTPAQPKLGVDEDDANMARRYGVSDAATVRQYGYHVPPEASVANVDQVKTLTDAEYDVLWGHTKASNAATVTSSGSGQTIPSGGCMKQGYDQVATAGSLASGEQLADQLDNEGFFESESDPKVVAAISAWSACMARSGYTEQSPLDPAQHFSGPLPASQAEITEATTDLACKQSTDLIPTWVAAETRIQNQLIAQHQVALDQLLQEQRGELEQATRFIG